MTERSRILQLIREHKTLFLVIAVGLFLIELEIFAIAAMKSGRTSRLQVLDDDGRVIYESDGEQLSDFNKYYFERTFGPFENYRVNLVTQERPFPFRAWFAAALGVPIGAILLFAFVIKAYTALVYGDAAPSTGAESRSPASANRFERLIHMISRFNIFIIGALVFLAVVAMWTLPNMINHLGHVGIETLVRFKWVVLGIALCLLGLITWIIYLRYLLAKKSIESQTAVDRYRLELEYQISTPSQRLLPPAEPSSGPRSLSDADISAEYSEEPSHECAAGGNEPSRQH